MTKRVDTMKPMTFSEALERLKAGAKVVNLAWNGKLQHLECQRPDEKSKMTHPYLFIEFAANHPNEAVRGKRVPWLASQLDIFSDEWVEGV